MKKSLIITLFVVGVIIMIGCSETIVTTVTGGETGTNSMAITLQPSYPEYEIWRIPDSVLSIHGITDANYVNKINAITNPIGYSGQYWKSPEETLNTHCGDLKDRSILLMALQKRFGTVVNNKLVQYWNPSTDTIKIVLASNDDQFIFFPGGSLSLTTWQTNGHTVKIWERNYSQTMYLAHKVHAFLPDPE